MTLNGWLQILFFLLAIFLATPVLGSFMARVFSGQRTWLDPVARPVERLIYRLSEVDETRGMRWSEYAVPVFLFSLVSMDQALSNFFGKGNLATLRELALRAVADKVSQKAASYRVREGLEPALIPERVMVCMSSNALAPRVIRTGARIAGRLGARWYAVYVETPREKPGRINPNDANALQENIRLAESLGATVVRVKAERPAEGLIAFAQREGVTHVIFGQSARSRWELLWRGSTLDRFLGAVPDAAVQVVPLSEE